MKITRILSFALAAVLLLCVFSGCGANAGITVTVRVLDYDKKVVAESDVTFSDDNPTALLALRYLCEEKGLECVFDENGVVTKIGKIEDHDEGNLLYYWSCNYNGKPARASYTTVETGGVVEFFVASMDNTPTTIVDPDAKTTE